MSDYLVTTHGRHSRTRCLGEAWELAKLEIEETGSVHIYAVERGGAWRDLNAAEKEFIDARYMEAAT